MTRWSRLCAPSSTVSGRNWVSTSGSRESTPDRVALQNLDGAVGAVLAELGRLRERLAEREGRVREVESLLAEMSAGEESPARMRRRLDHLEAENAELRLRLDEGREGVERLLAKIRFLEEQR
jgi:predicted RNase H-like nuclease (RuvC/YqgF family)